MAKKILYLPYTLTGYPQAIISEYKKLRSELLGNKEIAHLISPADLSFVIALAVARVQYKDLLELRFRGEKTDYHNILLLDDALNKASIRVAKLSNDCYLTPASRARKELPEPKDLQQQTDALTEFEKEA